ncbi:hypothetical protein [Lacticaseibacillus kribbianus]|uniref:hypothetical protein n=1 Tax=Lacticaseibacillus kribbianus TaxID=2926292 RepID=UPI001CD7CD72|nr:hypothetical protein [Lacticaseibacillus kribbianus]
MDDRHQCPWCGASDFVEAKHMPYQNVAAKNAVIGITGRANLVLHRLPQLRHRGPHVR